MNYKECLEQLPPKCENCGAKWPLTPAHRHERSWYKNRPELLWSLSQVIVLCTSAKLHKGFGGCHTYLDTHKDELETLFRKVRGEET